MALTLLKFCNCFVFKTAIASVFAVTSVELFTLLGSVFVAYVSDISLTPVEDDK